MSHFIEHLCCFYLIPLLLLLLPLLHPQLMRIHNAKSINNHNHNEHWTLKSAKKKKRPSELRLWNRRRWNGDAKSNANPLKDLRYCLQSLCCVFFFYREFLFKYSAYFNIKYTRCVWISTIITFMMFNAALWVHSLVYAYTHNLSLDISFGTMK